MYINIKGETGTIAGERVENKDYKMSDPATSTTPSSTSSTKRRRGEELPSLFHKVHAAVGRQRPVRSCRFRIPERYWGQVVRCIEYPDGIYIDHRGHTRPDKSVKLPSDHVERIPKHLWHTLSAAERAEQRSLLYDELVERERKLLAEEDEGDESYNDSEEEHEEDEADEDDEEDGEEDDEEDGEEEDDEEDDEEVDEEGEVKEDDAELSEYAQGSNEKPYEDDDDDEENEGDEEQRVMLATIDALDTDGDDDEDDDPIEDAHLPVGCGDMGVMGEYDDEEDIPPPPPLVRQ